MTKTVAEKLSDLVKAVRELPDDTQEVLVDEFADRLSDFTDSTLSDEQRAEIDRRLANPRYADPDKVREFFARAARRSEPTLQPPEWLMEGG
jgi:putative addiction module component (TIGR02574 family)